MNCKKSHPFLTIWKETGFLLFFCIYYSNDFICDCPSTGDCTQKHSCRNSEYCNYRNGNANENGTEKFTDAFSPLWDSSHLPISHVDIPAISEPVITETTYERRKTA